MFGYLYGTESVQAGSAKISKTLAPLNIHYLKGILKIYFFSASLRGGEPAARNFLNLTLGRPYWLEYSPPYRIFTPWAF
jgi:hypothetical protein